MLDSQDMHAGKETELPCMGIQGWEILLVY